MIKNRYKKRFENLSCCMKNKNSKLKTTFNQVKSENREFRKTRTFIS